MSPEEGSDLVRQVLSGALDPLAAAERLHTANRGDEFGFGLDLQAAGPEGAARLEVMMGRLLWLTLRGAGVDFPEPRSQDDYRSLLAQSMDEDDDAP